MVEVLGGATRGCLLLTLAILLQPTGCSSNGSKEGEEFLQLRARTLCGMNFRCCTEERQVFTRERCLEQRPFQLEQAFEAGQAHVDMAQARRCFSAVEALSCDEWGAVVRGGQIPSECEGVFEGRANGEPCTNYAQCASQYCDLTNPATPNRKGTSGVCGERAAEGEPCLTDVKSCQSGLACLGPEGVPACAPKLADGEPCDPVIPCASDICVDDVCGEACWGLVTYETLLGAT